MDPNQTTPRFTRPSQYLQPLEEPTEVADASTPEDLQPEPEPAGFDVPVQSTPITSDVLEGNTTFEDVRAFRDQQANLEETRSSLDNFDDTVQDPSPFNDPEQFILSSLYGDRDPSQAEEQAGNIRGDISRTTSRIDENLDRTTRRAEQTTQLSERDRALAETNEKIAQRQTRFRREIRQFEVESERRGVAREFFERDKQKLEADATAELADLYIIQNAQQGNLEAARDYIKTAVDNRYRSIQIELQQKQAELEALLPTLEKEEKQRAQELQIALQERQNNLETEKDNARTKRELAMQAARNGASQATIRSITNASSVDDALASASPFIGLLERQAAARAASNAALSRRMNLIKLAQAGDKAAINELGAYGEYLSSIQGDAEKKAREQSYINATQRIDLAQRIKQNTLGLNLNTGAIKSPWLAAGTAFGAGVGGGAVLGPVGAVIGGAIGLGSGGYILSQGTQAKEDFQADIKSLVAPGALQELVDQKAAGATFGALSNAELGLLLAASQELAGHVNINERDGTVSLLGSPEAIQADLDKVIGYYEKAARQTNIQELDTGSSSQIDSLFTTP